MDNQQDSLGLRPSLSSIRAVPLEIKDDDICRALELAEHPERAKPEEVAQLRARLIGARYGSHRYGKPLSSLSSSLWFELTEREPRSAEDHLRGWAELAQTPTDIATLLQDAAPRIEARAQALDEREASRLRHRFRMLRRRFEHSRSDSMVQAIGDASSVLAGHVINSDPDSTVGGEIEYLWPSGVSLTPEAGPVDYNHDALCTITALLYNVGEMPVPVMPPHQAPHWSPRLSEEEQQKASALDRELEAQFIDRWLPLLAQGLALVEARVDRELRAQESLWQLFDALPDETFGPQAELSRQVSRSSLCRYLASGGSLVVSDLAAFMQRFISQIKPQQGPARFSPTSESFNKHYEAECQKLKARYQRRSSVSWHSYRAEELRGDLEVLLSEQENR